MGKVAITVATAPYGRTEALRTGAVQVEGVDLHYLSLSVEEIFWRMLRHQEFDASEMSLSSYLIARDRGHPQLVAIPVFPFRTFRHGSIFINTASGIRTPADLKGKRVGVPEYEITASVWIRGILEHEYGVRPQDVTWFSGGEEEPGRTDKSRLELPPEVVVRPIPPHTTLDAMLVAGEIDALVAARMPRSLVEGDPRVARLFPDYRAVEEAYYRKTGIFPIMHCVCLRRDVHERYPWLAKNLEKAFSEAKRRWEEALWRGAVEHIAIPWFLAELEAELRVFGRDGLWPYGLGPGNRKVLETFIDYSYEQGLIRRRPSVEELFAESTLDQFRV